MHWWHTEATRKKEAKILKILEEKQQRKDYLGICRCFSLGKSANAGA